MFTTNARAAMRIVPKEAPVMQPAGDAPAIFAFEDQPVRTITIDGEPWFVARDVAEVLGYANASKAIADHCKGGVTKRYVIDALGRSQETTIIPERDVYRLIMRSKLPSAERFEEWVVGTVLPTIRKTGSYVAGEEAFDVTTDAGLAAATAHVLAALQAKADSYKAQYDLAKPKADAFTLIEEAAGSVLVRDAAKALKSTQKALYAALESRGWVTTKTTRNPQRKATAQATQAGYMTTRTTRDDWGNLRTTPMVTPKGLARLAQIKARQQAR